jgi:hypothetical protein
MGQRGTPATHLAFMPPREFYNQLDICRMSQALQRVAFVLASRRSRKDCPACSPPSLHSRPSLTSRARPAGHKWREHTGAHVDLLCTRRSYKFNGALGKTGFKRGTRDRSKYIQVQKHIS